MPKPMKPTSILFAAVATVVTLCGIRSARAQADIPADYLSIIGNTAGTVSDGYGSPGSIPVHGKASFPILIDVNNVPVLAAGRYGNGVSATAARAVAASHTGFFNTSGTNTTSQLFLNSVLWASRKPTPETITVGSTNSSIRSFFSTRGYSTKAITTNMLNSDNDLTDVDVFVGNFHDGGGFTANAIAKIQAHAANGGGVVVCSTPWALSAQPFADAQSVLGPFGLSISGSGVSGSSFTVAAASYPAYHSALNGLDALVADVSGGPAMTFAEKQIAAGSLERVIAARPDLPDILAGIQTLEDSGYGLIQPTAAAPLVKAGKPIEVMLARFQSARFDTMTPEQLFAHPCAADFPGLPTAGGTVSRTIPVNGNTFPDVYMNQGNKPVRVETGVYAAPGATITITIPADKTAAGLQAHIAGNGSEDQIWGKNDWTFFPKLWRRVPLTTTTTQTGNVFGGLVTILVPANSNLGTFDVTVSGALPAPAFVMGQNTDAEWNTTLKNHPAPYGFLQTDKITIYIPKSQLVKMSNPEAVAAYWKNVMDTADEYYGYTAWRKRGEAITSARSVLHGGAYAGYPIETSWGVTDDAFLNAPRINGSWGCYHELGHGYQNNFDNAFVIPTHAEVDVNLMPGMIYTFVHDKTTWDFDSNFYGWAHRLSHRTAFLALPEAGQTWAAACQNNSSHGAAYDFYYNLSDAFGWQAYKTMFSRLMDYLQNPAGSADTALKNLDSGDPNFRRNRFYLLMCDATGRNLDAYFQRYGLGVPGKGFEITQSVKDQIAAKDYPVWSDNSEVDSLSNPGTLDVSEGTAPGVEIYQFTAIDEDEPGTIWDYQITAGNTNDAFSIDKRTGKLRVRLLDAETTASYNLTVTVQDNGVPRFSKTATFTVNVDNVVEPPMPGTSVLNATSAMSSGTVLGPGIIADASRSFTSTSILSGNGSGAFAIDAAGQIVLQNPAALPSASLLTLVVSGTDSAGATGSATIRVLANATPGLREQRWSGTTNFTNNTWTGTANYTGNLNSATTGQNVANSYSRRLLGWLIPPVTGEYTFWISSDDSSRFYLGTDETEASKSLLCSLSGSTGFQNFDGNGSQMSDPVTLEAGKAYWFEAQQSEVSGSDHVSVAWQGAGIPTRGIVAGAYLIPNQAGIVMPVEGNGVWINAAGGSWPTAGNWAGEAVAGGTGRTADFGTLNLLADATVTLDGPRMIGNLTFGDTTPSHNWIVNAGSGGPLTLDLATGMPVIAVNNGTTTLNVVLAGTKGLAKTGAGNLILGAENLYSGGTTITPAGDTTAVTAASAAAFGGDGVLLNGVNTFSAGLRVNTGLTIPNALTLKPVSGRTVLGLTGTANWSGDITVDGSSSNQLAIVLAGGTAANPSIVSGNIGHTGTNANLFVLRNSGSRGNVTGSISYGTGTVQLLDSTHWQFSNASNTWGTLDISHAEANAYVGAADVLSPTGVVSSTVGGTLRLNDLTTTDSHSQSIAGLNGNVKVTVGTGSPTLTLNTPSNRSSSGVISGALSLVKSGPAMQTLSGTNTYTGTTTVSGGTLNVTGSLSTGAVTVQGGTLAGTGAIGGATTVETGGMLAPSGTLTMNNTLTLAGGSRVALEIRDWTGEAGTAWDKTTVTSLNLTATSGNRVTIRPVDLAPANFTETDATFVLIQTTTGITGFSADKFTVDTSGLTLPQGYWKVLQSGDDLVLAYTVTANPDANDNGILDDWEIENFGNADPGANLPGDDADNDGITNLMEYALGTNPLAFTAGPATDLETIADAAHLRMTVNKNPQATNLIYTVETCGALGDWSAVNTVIETDTATQLIVRDTFSTGTAARRFIRLRVRVVP